MDARTILLGIFIDILAAPYCYEGSTALMAKQWVKAGVAYAIGLPLAWIGLSVAGILPPLLGTAVGDYIRPIASDPRWWFALLLFTLVWIGGSKAIEKIKAAWWLLIIPIILILLPIAKPMAVAPVSPQIVVSSPIVSRSAEITTGPSPQEKDDRLAPFATDSHFFDHLPTSWNATVSVFCFASDLTFCNIAYQYRKKLGEHWIPADLQCKTTEPDFNGISVVTRSPNPSDRAPGADAFESQLWNDFKIKVLERHDPDLAPNDFEVWIGAKPSN